MKKFSLNPLVQYLNDQSRFFTSVAFFIALVALSLSINPNSSQSNQFVVLFLQGSSLGLLALCLLTICKDLDKKRATVLKIFTILMFLAFAGFIGYIWYEHAQAVSAAFYIAAVVAGLISARRIHNDFSSAVKLGIKTLRKDLGFQLIFWIFVIVQLFKAYLGAGDLESASVLDLTNFVRTIWNYIFLGILLYAGLLILTFLAWCWSRFINGIRN